MNLSVSTEDVAGRRVVSVRGEVDVYSAPTLRKCVQEAMDEHCCDLIVDLSHPRHPRRSAEGRTVTAYSAGHPRRTGDFG